MLQGSTTKRGAGILLTGDYADLACLHDTLHYLARDSGPMTHYQQEYVLGLAYDVRHAFQGDRLQLPADEYGDRSARFGVQVLWPIFLAQLSLLRSAAAFTPTKNAHQADLYRLEACVENALAAVNAAVADDCLTWLRTNNLFTQNYLLEHVNATTRTFVSVARGVNKRVSFLPKVLQDLSPLSEAYLEFAARVHERAAELQREPQDLQDASDWDPFLW